MKRILFIMLMIACGVILTAQPLRETTPEMLVEAADLKLAEKDYYNAVDLYEQAYKELRDPALAFRIAKLHGDLRDYKRAESWFSRIVKRDKEFKFLDAKYYYGLYLKKNGKLQEAYDQLVFYIDSSKNEMLVTKAKNEILGIQLSESFPLNEDILILNLGSKVNSFYTDASPSIDADGNLFLTSFQRSKLIVQDGKETDYHAKIYSTSRDKKGQWQKPRPLPDIINGEGIHQGNASISRDGGTLFFTKMILDGNYVANSRIYMAKKKGRGWSTPVEVEGIHGNYIVKHPMEGELFGDPVLYFSANIDGGKGGFDLYYAPRQSEAKYGLPVNLGEVINTSGDDVTPFYSDGTLHYSTDGHPGFGGFDVFKTSWDGSKWSTPRNLGQRYNSSADDLFFTLDPVGENGFLVSNRANTSARSLKSKTCCDDIYFFTEKTIQINLITGVFGENGPLLGANVKLVERVEKEDGKSVSKDNPDGNRFDFSLETDKAYFVEVTRDGYYPESFEFNTVGIVENHDVKRNVTLTPKPVEIETETITVTEPIRLNNIYYDFDDDQILPDAEKDLSILQDLLNRYPDMVIELSSHTDAQGSDPYNEDLSQRRAESARSWLIDKGIDPDRVKAVGYGERFILNECVNGVKCDDDQHRFNRRTEFKILSGPTTIEIQKEILKNNNPGPRGPNVEDVEGYEFAPKIRFSKSFHDFGLVDQGDLIKHEFEFTNIGDDDLLIKLVTANKNTKCKWEKTPIKPGEISKIKAEFNTKNIQGEHEVTIQIVSNTKPKVAEARFRAFISPK